MKIFNSPYFPAYFSTFTLGITTFIAQIILLREFLSVFYGNELIIGMFLADWMLLTAAGAYIGKFFKFSNSKLIFLQILIGILPLFTCFIINALRNILFPVGSMVDIISIFYTSFFMLLPFCFVSGMFFTFLCSEIFEKNNKNHVSTVYSVETAGSLAAGIVFNFFIINILNSFQHLSVLLILNLISVFYHFSCKIKSCRKKIIFIIFSLFLTFISLFFDWNFYTKKLLFENQVIEYQRNTKYGNLTVTKSGEQHNFYENGVFLFSDNHIEEAEESVHYAMIQHFCPQKVLLVSGGISGMISEIAKYSPQKIDYIEPNSEWINIAEKYISQKFKIPQLVIIQEDVRLFLKKNTEKYDVVLLHLPEPNTLHLNRFYTVEFFTLLKNSLSDSAVISLSLPAVADYMNFEAKQTHSILLKTLKQVFKNVLIVSGNANYFLSSDNNLSINVLQKINEKKIETVYVNSFYIDENDLTEKSLKLMRNLDANCPINKDFQPISAYKQMQYWLSHFENHYALFGLGFLLTVLLFLVFLNRIHPILFATGFFSTSLEIILLMSFQIFYGNMFQMLGIMVMLFMGGLAAGGWWFHKFLTVSQQNMKKLQIFIGIFCAILPIFIYFLNKLTNFSFFVHFIFAILILLVGILTGMQFALSTRLQTSQIKTVAAQSYSADLLGAAAGAIWVSIFALPLLGLTNTCLSVAGINFLCLIIMILWRKH